MKKLLSLLLLLALLTGCTVTPSGGTTIPSTTAPGITGTAPTEETTPPPAVPENLTVHFIDVGQADCALLECDGEFMLIDGGNREDSSLVVSYLEQQGVTKLEAVVCSHPHEDHVGGLPGVLAVYETAAVYAPTRTYSSNVYDDFLYYADQQGLEVTIPQPGDTFDVGSATVTVLGPVKSYANPNDTSLILRVEYGDTAFLFTGDMETTAERDMLDYWGDDFDWHVDVLKVGHHGSDTSTGYRFLNAAMPTYGVISVGKDNSYGHPHEVPLSRLEDAGVTLFRTDYLGHVLAVSDGDRVTFTWNNQNAQPEIPTVPPVTEPPATDPSEPDPTESTGESQVTFVGNRNSKKFHSPTCKSLPKEENRVYFDRYEDAIAAGYEPCKSCKPSP